MDKGCHRMQIARLFYPVHTLGWGKRIGIWTVGCFHGCSNCSNPELWKPDSSKEVSMDTLRRLLSSVSEPVDGVTISGGEPFEQADDLEVLVNFVREQVTDDILIYSGYTLEELKERRHPSIDRILYQIAALVDGKYMEELNDNHPLRGSSNQRIHILNEAYRSRYEALLTGKRKVQTVFYQKDLLSIGIPVKRYREVLNETLEMNGISSK